MSSGTTPLTHEGVQIRCHAWITFDSLKINELGGSRSAEMSASRHLVTLFVSKQRFECLPASPPECGARV